MQTVMLRSRPGLILAVAVVCAAIYVAQGIFDGPYQRAYVPAFIPPFEMTMEEHHREPDGSMKLTSIQRVAFIAADDWSYSTAPPPGEPGTLYVHRSSDMLASLPPEYPGCVIPTDWFIEGEAWIRRYGGAVSNRVYNNHVEVRNEGPNQVYRVVFGNGFGDFRGQQLVEEYVYIPELPVPVEKRFIDQNGTVSMTLRATSLVIVV